MDIPDFIPPDEQAEMDVLLVLHLEWLDEFIAIIERTAEVGKEQIRKVEVEDLEHIARL